MAFICSTTYYLFTSYTSRTGFFFWRRLSFDTGYELAQGFAPSSDIPKIVWAYWNSSEETWPQTTRDAVASWRIKNPDYDIRVVTPATLPEKYHFIYHLRHASWPQQVADFVRVHLLAEHGGVWVDSSVFTLTSLNWIHALQRNTKAEFIGYYNDWFTTRPETPVIENWFFACVPQSPFVAAWRDAFMEMNNYNTTQDYVDAIEAQGIDLQKIDPKSYLTMHVAHQKVLQSHGTTYPMHLMSTFNGPAMYLALSDADPDKAVHALVEGRYLNPIIKLRGGERFVLEQLGKSSEFLNRFVLNNGWHLRSL